MKPADPPAAPGAALLRLEFADSEVASVRLDGGTLALRFSAARVRPVHGREGDDVRYAAGLTLQLADVRTTASLAGCLGRLAEGELRLGGRVQGWLALPAHATGPLQLGLRFANGSQLDATASGLSAPLPPGTAVAEHYRC